MANLVERLRSAPPGSVSYEGAKLVLEAADEIEKLRTEVDELTHLRTCRDQWQAQTESLHDKNKRLRSELLSVMTALRLSAAGQNPDTGYVLKRAQKTLDGRGDDG